MTFAQWDTYLDTNITATRDTAAPVDGSGSFKFTGAAVSEFGVSVPGAGLPNKGYTLGKVRSRIKATGTGVYYGGLFCMASQADLRTAGNGYALLFSTLGFDMEIVLQRLSGSGISSRNQLAISGTGQWAEGTPFTLELEWRYHAMLDAVHLIGRLGTLADYTDLVQLFEYVERSFVYTTSVTEGLWVDTGASASVQAWFDTTEILEGTPTLPTPTTILDWDVYHFPTSPSVGNDWISIGHDPVNKLLGSADLVFSRNTAEWAGSARPGATIPKALTSGKLRTLLNFDYGSGVVYAGLYCLSSQPNVSGSVGSFYLVYLDSSLTEDRIRLAKVGAGLMAASYTVLETSGVSAWTPTVTLALEFEWVVTAGQAVLTVRTGLQTDFSDLSQLLTHTDTSSPYTTSAGEGPGVRSAVTGTNIMAIYSNTQLDQV